MRQVLGTMYDKYETFNLCLYSFTQAPGLGLNSIIQNSQNLVDVRIRGLQFLNSSYNVVSRNNNINSAFLTTLQLVSTPTGNTYTGLITLIPNTHSITFGKNADCVDITIDMRKVSTQLYPTITENMAFGAFIFAFKIYGIPKKDNNIITNGSRM